MYKFRTTCFDILRTQIKENFPVFCFNFCANSCEHYSPLSRAVRCDWLSQRNRLPSSLSFRQLRPCMRERPKYKIVTVHAILILFIEPRHLSLCLGGYFRQSMF